MLDLVERTKDFCLEQGLLTPADRVLIGLSGGADSVCLLLVLAKLRKRLSLTLFAFHVNHQIRGEAADRDEQFCRELCGQWGISFQAVREDIPAIAKLQKKGLEEAGREVRYRTADKLADELSCNRIALAHQKNDVAETFLFHLFRGSSFPGLSSIPAKRGRIIRPLLDCSRDEIECFLAQCGQAFCTDATNFETDYSRNKIRHCILSYANENINQRSTEHIAKAAGQIRRLNDFFQKETERVLSFSREVPGGWSISCERLQSVQELLAEETVYRLLCRTAGRTKDITSKHVTGVLSLLEKQSGKEVSLPYGMKAERSFSDLRIIKKEAAVPFQTAGKNENMEFKKTCPEHIQAEAFGQMLTVPGEYFLGTTGLTLTLSLFPNKKNLEIPKNEYTKWFDYGKIKGILRLRQKKSGDRIGLLQGSKSLKAVLTEKKVPKEQREKLWVLADEEQVLLIPFVRTCDNYRVEEQTENILEVRINGGETDGNECSRIDFRGGSKKESC